MMNDNKLPSMFDQKNNSLFEQSSQVHVHVPQQRPVDIHEMVNQEVAQVMSEQAVTALQDENLKENMREAATTIVNKKVDTVVKQVTAENNEANAELEEEALNCFGYKPGKSVARWQTKWAGSYHSVLSAVWMFIAMFTFAPIIFVAKKLNTAAKVTWWGIVFGFLIYVGIICAISLPLLLSGCASPDAMSTTQTVTKYQLETIEDTPYTTILTIPEIVEWTPDAESITWEVNHGREYQASNYE